MRCTVENCENEAKCRGLCNKHYHVMRQTEKLKPCGCGCGELTSYIFKWGHHTRLFTSEEQARRGRQNTGDAQRDRGEGKTYRKVAQRHEHRVVAEHKLGRLLLPCEIVHHRDGNKRNNTPENLEVLTRAEHLRVHFKEMMEARRHVRGY